MELQPFQRAWGRDNGVGRDAAIGLEQTDFALWAAGDSKAFPAEAGTIPHPSEEKYSACSLLDGESPETTALVMVRGLQI